MYKRCMLFASFYRKFSEFFKIFHKSESCLTCAGTCSLISFLSLSLCIYCKLLILGFDSFDEFFHDFQNLLS